MSLKKLERVLESNNRVEVKVASDDPAPRPLHCHDSLLWSPLNLQVDLWFKRFILGIVKFQNLGTKWIQADVMCQIKPKLVLFRIHKHGFGGTEGSHVNGLAGINPPQVDGKLQLPKCHWGELPCGSQSVVVAPFKGCLSLDRCASWLVTKRSKVLFGTSARPPSNEKKISSR